MSFTTSWSSSNGDSYNGSSALNSAQRAYNSINTARAASAGTRTHSNTFNEFRQKLINAHNAALKDKSALSDESQRIARTYARDTALEQISKLKAAYAAKITAVKDDLLSNLNSIQEQYKHNLSAYVIAPLSTDAMQLLQTYRLRDGAITDMEIESFLWKYGANYSAAVGLKSILDNGNSEHTIIMPVDPESIAADIDALVGSLTKIVLTDLDSESTSLRGTGILREYESGTPEIDMINRLDSMPETMAAKAEISLRDKADKAAAGAWAAMRDAQAAGNTAAVHQHAQKYQDIKNFTANNADDLESREQRQERLSSALDEMSRDYI